MRSIFCQVSLISASEPSFLLTLSERPETPPPPFATTPFRRDPNFVNRGDILRKIHDRCAEPAGRVALVGLGGVGKSQLAIEFAHRTAEIPARLWVFWVHASTRARVGEGFRMIADAVKIPGRQQPEVDIPELVYSWLSQERNGRWVVILDSADDGDVFYGATDVPDGKPLASYLPQSRNGSILITTRNRDLARRLAGDQSIIEVGTMIEAEALSLLEKRLGTIADWGTATELVRALEHVPLAVSQAAGYIQARAPRTSLEKYLADFRGGERKRTRLLGHDGGDLRRDGSASNAVLTTWQMSFEHIRSKRRSAADLLSLMSYFNPQGIPESLLKPTDLTSDFDSEEESNTDCSRGGADSEFDDDVELLRDFCLVKVNDDGMEFEMHGLVQLSTRKWLEAKGLQETFKQRYIAQLGASFPTGDYSNWTTCQRLFSHVEAAIDYKPVEKESEERWAYLLCNGARYARSQGRYDVAERMACESKRSRERLLGKEDLMTLLSISLLADVLRDKGRWGDAEKLEVHVLETRKTKLGVDHPDILISMSNLASTFWNQGRWEDAEKLEVQVLETRKTKLGVDHPDTLTSMSNLASTFWNQGRWEDAEKLEVQVLETRKTKLGVDHPDTLTGMSNLASTFWNQGRWEDAEKLDVQVLETRKTKLGVDHPDILKSMNNLASTYRNQGRWEDAEKLEVQVLETSKTKLGVDHPDTLITMNNLAFIWKSQGRHADALTLMRSCLQARQRVLGHEHPFTIDSLSALNTWSGEDELRHK
jgi:tetratricopeptide (TPR) repeat protein